MVCGLGAQSLNGSARGRTVETCPHGQQSIAKSPNLCRVAAVRASGTAARYPKAERDALFRDNTVRFRDLGAAD